MEIIAHYSKTVLFMPQQDQSFAGRNAERMLLPGLVLWSWGKMWKMTNGSVVMKRDADQTGLGGFFFPWDSPGGEGGVCWQGSWRVAHRGCGLFLIFTIIILTIPVSPTCTV